MSKWALPLLLLLPLAACASLPGARSVAILVDGETRLLTTDARTVRDALAEAGVTLDENDRVTPVEPSVIDDGMAIRVIRVETETETRQRVLPFGRRTVIDRTVPTGETRLLERGETGIEELTYRITTEDGEPVERTLVQRAVVREPREEVVLYGGQAELEPVAVTGTVAFVNERNIWVIQATSANQRRLTHSGDLDGQVFRLAPDGSYVLYTRAPADTVSQSGDGSPVPPFNTFWMVEIAPGTPEPIRLDVEGVLWADWGPDCTKATMGAGCRIAYSTGTAVPGNPGWRSENDLWTAEPDPSQGQLADRRGVVEPGSGGAYGWWGSTYAWSPDGSKLAYGSADEVGVIDVDTGEPTPLADFPPYRTYAPWVWTPTVSWSPEGDIIIAVLHTAAPSDPAPQDSPRFDIWALRADGSFTVSLVKETGMWAAPRYAGAGDLIAFGQARSPRASGTSHYDLMVMDSDGSDRVPLFPPPHELGLEYPEIAWSPASDGLMVIYRGDLYLISPLDAKVVPVTAGGGTTRVDWR